MHFNKFLNALQWLAIMLLMSNILLRWPSITIKSNSLIYYTYDSIKRNNI